MVCVREANFDHRLFLGPVLRSVLCELMLRRRIVMMIMAMMGMMMITRQSKHCGFSIYIFDSSKSKLMVRLVRAEQMVWSGLVFARKIARMILIQNV